MILISIQPEHCKNIFNGSKTVEWRTKPLPLDRAAVYETKGIKQVIVGSENQRRQGELVKTKGNGKVIGEFSVISTLKYATVNDIPESVIMAGCVSRQFLQAYSKGKPLYANYIDNVELYDETRELGEFRKPCGNCIGKCTGEHYDRCPWQTITRPPQSYMRIQDPKED